MNDFSLHLAPNVPWLPLALLAAAFALLAAWGYRIAVPPLPPFARTLLPWLRGLALVGLLALLARPVLERPRGGDAAVVVLRDASASMELPASAGGPPRAAAAERAIAALRSAWRGRARVAVVDFAERLESDSGRVGARGATALGDALRGFASSPLAERAGSVVVVSDGVSTAGEDPVAAARALGLPVHTVAIGGGAAPDRAIAGIEAPASARVGERTPVRVRIASDEPPGTAIPVTLADGSRVLARGTAIVPAGGAEATVELDVRPDRPGLALWTARVDSLAGELTAANDARGVAIEVAPGKLGVLVVSGGLNWDLAFVRRALAADSGLAVATRVRARGGWTSVERGSPAAPPSAADLRGTAVVVLDVLAPRDVSPEFDRALAAFVRAGGGLWVLAGPPPGLARQRDGALGAELAAALDPARAGRPTAPEPAPEARDLLMWDDDPARSDRAWRDAAPLKDVQPLAPGAGDRTLVGSAGGPLLFTRRAGRGPVLVTNGTGLWRWSLDSEDDRAAERGRTLWRRLARWLAEPVQGEPLRVRADRLLANSGEPVTLVATLQDEAFRPLAGAAVTGEATSAGSPPRPLRFEARGAGAYEARLEDLAPGRWNVRVSASRGGRALGSATGEFGVDRFSLELARTRPDSATLAAVAEASGGRATRDAAAESWARALGSRALARGRTVSLRLWESPWVFALVVALLSAEWIVRRRRGLP